MCRPILKTAIDNLRRALRSSFSTPQQVLCNPIALSCLAACALATSGCSFVERSVSKNSNARLLAPQIVKLSAVSLRPVVGVPVSVRVMRSVSLPKLRLPAPALGLTPEVKRELDRFLTSDRRSIVKMIERRAQHDGMISAVFDEHGLPNELANLAGIESHFNPGARSPAGAKGMWQFMAPTANLYGLEVSKKTDDRTDPKLSTMAAAKFLKDLYLNYRDWHMALAAYNAGCGRLGKAVNSVGSNNFWTLARSGSLSRETERFVPKFIALSLIMKEPERYGFDSGSMIG